MQPRAFLKGPGRGMAERVTRTAGRAANLVADLLDLGAGQITKMDQAGIDMQVVSLTAPGVEQSDPGETPATAREANDYVADAVRRYPDRLAKSLNAVSMPASKVR